MAASAAARIRRLARAKLRSIAVRRRLAGLLTGFILWAASSDLSGHAGSSRAASGSVLTIAPRRCSTPLATASSRCNASKAAKVTTALRRLELANFSNVKGVGAGVFEYRIDFGPGYRVYFGKDGDTVVILLAGGTKKRQDKDIADAHERWTDYKQRKSQQT